MPLAPFDSWITFSPPLHTELTPAYVDTSKRNIYIYIYIYKKKTKDRLI